MACKICDKHKRHEKKASPDFIAERGGWRLFHYPQEPGERVIRGHLLLETDRHIEDLAELTEEEAAAMGTFVRDIVGVQRGHLEAEHVYMFRINDKVPHLHVHLIPRYKLTPKQFWGTNITNWSEGPRVGVDSAKVLVEKLRTLII
jgi:histidine triad (HIT) family protein